VLYQVTCVAQAVTDCKVDMYVVLPAGLQAQQTAHAAAANTLLPCPSRWQAAAVVPGRSSRSPLLVYSRLQAGVGCRTAPLTIRKQQCHGGPARAALQQVLLLHRAAAGSCSSRNNSSAKDPRHGVMMQAAQGGSLE
jgi:hypothetical protein